MTIRTTIYVKRLLLTLLLLTGLPAVAQSWNIQNGDTLFINGCQYASGNIYDNGGSTGDYSNSFDGWVIIEATAGTNITLSGNYRTEYNHDIISIYNNETLVNEYSGIGNFPSISCTTGRVVIRFHTDGNTTNVGFSLHFNVATGYNPDKVSNLTANAITATGATLQWTSGSSHPFHIISDGSPIDTVTTTTTSYTLTGLNPSMRHTVVVYAEGMENNRCAKGEVQFRTACGTGRLPLVEDFNDVTTNEIAPCWTRSVNFDDAYTLPRVVDIINGNKAQMLSCGSNGNSPGHFGMVIAPPRVSTSQEWHISFKMRVSHAYYTKVIVGFCDSTSSEQQSYGFTQMEVLSANNTEWITYNKTYTVPNGKCRLAFRMEQSMQSGYGGVMAYIDNLSIEGCGVRQARTAHHDISSFDVLWSTVGSPDVTVRVKPAWGNDTGYVFEHAVSPLAVTGLTPNTRYEVTFFPSCNGEQQVPLILYANTLPFEADTTLCLYLTYFNTQTSLYSLNDRWTFINNSGYNPEIDGSFYLRNNCYLVSPPLFQPGGKEVMLTYSSNSPSTDRVVVGTMTYPDDISTFTPIDTVQVRTSVGFADTTVRLPNGITDRYLAFRALCAIGSSVKMRSVSLNSGHVTGARVTHVRSTEVTLRWNAPTTGSVIIEYYNTSDHIIHTDTVSNTNQAVVSGLLPQHDYYFNLYLPGNTACPPVGELLTTTARRDYDIPYCEDFEDFIPDENYGWNSYMTVYGCPSRSVEYTHSAGNSLKLAAASGNYSSVIALPDIEGIEGSTISFWAYTLSPSSSVVLGYYPPNSTLFLTIATLPIAGNVGWQHYVYELPTNISGRLALKYQLSGCEGIYYVWIDDLVLGSANYGEFNFANLTGTDVDVVWQAAGTTDSITVIMESNSGTVTVSGTPDTIHVSGLTPMRHYDCYVIPNGGCLTFAGSFFTLAYDNGAGAAAFPMCNSMDNLLSYELPQGWTFSDITLNSLVDNGNGGYWLRMLSPSAPGLWTTDTLPAISYNMLYLQARGIGDNVKLAVNGDTVTLDTVWHPYAFLPAANTTISVSGGTGCLLDSVALSPCPGVDFSVDGNTITCTVQGGQHYEYILRLSDGNGDERGYHITSAQFVIADLQPSTEYRVWWHCLYMDPSCIPSFTISTRAIPLPYCINFEGNNNTLPAGWIATERPGYDDVTFEGTDRMRFIASSYKWNYLALPPMEYSDYLQLNIHGYFSGVALEVGHLANGSDTSSFVTDTVVIPQTMNYDGDYCFVLRNIGSHRICLRYRGNCLSIAKLGISRTPLLHFHIFSPSTLTIQAETDSVYKLGHNRYSSDYYFRTVTTNPTTESFYTNNNYLYLKQFAGSDCSPQFAFQKPPTATMPYCDEIGFNQIGEMYTVHPANSSFVNYYDNGWQSSYRMSPCTWNKPVVFVLPYITNSSVGNTKITFECKAANSGCAVEVGVLTDLLDTSTFVPVDTILCSTTGWHRVYVDMSRYSGSGRWIALRGQNSMLNGDFFFDNLTLDACYMPATTSLHLENYTEIVFSGNNQVNGPLWVEYGPYGISSGQGTLVHFDSLPARLNLSPSTTYTIFLYCGNNRQGCENQYVISTLDLPLYVPSCTGFESNGLNYTPQGWTAVNGPSVVTNATSHEGTRSLSIGGTVASPLLDIDTIGKVAVGFWVKSSQSGNYLIVGTMTNPTSPSSFHPLKTIVPKQVGVWEYHLVSLSDAPANARHLAFRNSSSDGSPNLFIDALLVTTCTAFDLRIAEFNNSSIKLSWNQLGSPDILLNVRDNTSSLSTQYDLSSLSTHTFSLPIIPQHDYQITVSASCSTEGMPCAVPYSDTINIVMPANGFGCVDPADLNSPQAVFFSGTYNNPYANRGPIDFGNSRADSRHTINYDTSARDPRTGNRLRTIPPGYSSSVRLGNWSTNSSAPEAEGVIYSLHVDTLDFSLLLMQYAAVLQDPMHAPEDQPRFRLELLDSNFSLIDPLCTAADFIADRSLGWNEAPDNVLWKDWTTVGVDLTAYHGQQVYLRLTTYDCNEGSHFGYAYFTLECMLKNLSTESCGNVDSNRFTAPAGFNYRWYAAGSSSTLSTSRTLTVPVSQSAVYLCDLSFVGNPSCSFTLSAFGGHRYPLARVDTLVSYSDCRIHVQFLNRSTVSSDGITPVSTGEAAETAHWDFGNGLVSDSYNGFTSYDAPGTYIVTLVAGISGGLCTDTLRFPLTVDFPTHPTIAGPSSLCFGEPDTLWLLNASTADPLWSHPDGSYLPLSPNNYQLPTTNYTLLAIDPYGCSATLSHTLRIHPSYTRFDSLFLCPPQLPFTYADTTLLPGTSLVDYHHLGRSSAGCDSSFHLHLQVLPLSAATGFDTVEASICDNQSYYFFGQFYSLPGEHLVNRVDTLAGRCDSLHSLFLQVRPTSAVDTVIHSCSRFLWHTVTYFVDTIVSHLDTNRFLCDSVTTLHLFIHPDYDIKDPIVVCPNERYIYEGVDYGGPIAFDSPHTTLFGCDSLVHVNLYPSDPRFPAPPVVSTDALLWHRADTLFLGCNPQPLHLHDTSISSARAWTLWAVADPAKSFSSNDRLFSPLVDTTGLFAFQLVTVSPEGCIDTFQRDSILWVFPSPQAAFFWSPSHLSIHNPQAQFYNQSSFDTLHFPLSTLNYTWLFPLDPSASSFDTSFVFSPFYSWEVNTDTGDYPVSLIAYLTHLITLSPAHPDTLVCTDTLTLPVRIVNTYLSFPNSVTPNGDGVNDRWEVVNLLEMGEYSMNELWIYDRWGALVYHVKDISKPSDFWDPNDTHSPDGTYYFRFMAKNNFGIVKRNGVIEVTR